MSKLSFATNKHGNAITSEQQKPPGSSGKQRVSRWDIQPKIDGQGGESDSLSKRRKTRWSDDSQEKLLGLSHLPALVKNLVEANLDPEIQELKKKLLTINQRIQEVGVTVGRNSSSSPVYDVFGIKIDSGDANIHEKLIEVRQDIIAKLIEKNKPPPANKLRKLAKRLYIPTRQYPSYNFTGLIIGPRGNTIQRMEKETGAKIMLRGKGSRKDGKELQKPDPFDEEDLHVLIEAENQKSLDDAVGMVETLLLPVEEGMNEHKRAQLRELAYLSGTLRDDNFCNCGQVKHMKYACPSMNLVSPHGISCSTCGGSTHYTLNCPLTVSTLSGDLAIQQKRSFLEEIGGAGAFTFGTQQTSSDPWHGGNTHYTVNCPLTVSTPSGDLAIQQKRSFLEEIGGAGAFTFGTHQTSSDPWQGGNTGFSVSPAYGSKFDSGEGSTPATEGMSSNEIDHIKLMVRHIPRTVDDVRLRELFAPFGRLIEAKVMMGTISGVSQEKGFVKYDNPSNAMAAVVHMNGYILDGKKLTVKVAENPSKAVVSSTSFQPCNYAPAMASQDNVSPASWPGPPGSMLSDTQFSSSKSHTFSLPQSSVFLGQSGTSNEQFHSSHCVPLSSPSLLQFPGNPDYHKHQPTSHLSPPSNFSPQMHPRPSLSGSMSPSPWPPIQYPRSGTFDFP